MTRRGAALVASAAVALAIVVLLMWSAAGRPDTMRRHAPVVVLALVQLEPAVVRVLRPATIAPRAGPFARAGVGERVPVELTAYCLHGFTRRDTWVRDGIVAADPRVFPLGRYVELFIGGAYRGRYLVDDTGLAIKGPILDIWMPTCNAARQFGRRRGVAVLVAAASR